MLGSKQTKTILVIALLNFFLIFLSKEKKKSQRCCLCIRDMQKTYNGKLENKYSEEYDVYLVRSN